MKDISNLARLTLSVSELFAEGSRLSGLGYPAEFFYPLVSLPLGPYWWEKCRETRWCFQSVWWQEPRGRRKHSLIDMTFRPNNDEEGVCGGTMTYFFTDVEQWFVKLLVHSPENVEVKHKQTTDERIFISLVNLRWFTWKWSKTLMEKCLRGAGRESNKHTNKPKKTRNGPIFDSTLVKMVRILKANSSAKALFLETDTPSASNLCSTQACHKNTNITGH